MMDRSPDAATSGAGGRHGLPWRAAGACLVALLALLGAGLIGASLRQPAPMRPPQPLAEAAPTDLATGPGGALDPVLDASAPVNPSTEPAVPGAGASPTPTYSATPTAQLSPAAPAPIGLARSAATEITIARIGVAAKVIRLGVNADGTIQVPPLERAELAGWYEPGVSPGEIGNAVIVGHVDSRYIGPAVFFRLGELKPGDVVLITRADRTVVRFRVDGVKSYPKNEFPTELVYGPSDRPSLRLVTCGGYFDRKSRNYQDNVIAFATMMP